jgi:ketosteroid isomerase-like protein
MYKYLWLVPIIFLLNACKTSINKEAESKALLETGKEWSKSIAAGNMESVFDYWTEDAVIYPVGITAVKGKDAIRKFVAVNRSQPDFSLITNPLEATVSNAGDIGYTVGNYKVSMDAPDGSPIIRKGRYLCAWRKVDGSWKCNLEIHSPLGMSPDIGSKDDNNHTSLP